MWVELCQDFWLQDTGGPEFVVSLLVDRPRYWGHWLRGPRCPRVGFCLLVGRTRGGADLQVVRAWPREAWD